MQIDPNWIAGFVDGEGTFYIGINKHPDMKSGYQILPEFRIVQHERDIQLLYNLKKYFGAGVVRVNHDTRYELRIRDISALAGIVIPFFQKYPLYTQKKFDFLKFAQVIDMMKNGEHLDSKGIIKIIDVAEKMNRCEKTKAKEIKNQLNIEDTFKVHTS